MATKVEGMTQIVRLGGNESNTLFDVEREAHNDIFDFIIIKIVEQLGFDCRVL
jgi:hypothetical protein